MKDVTFVKLCVAEPTAPFITEVRGPFGATVWDSIAKGLQENPEEIASWELPTDVMEVWCVIEEEGDGHWDGIPIFWYLVPIRPLRCELLPREE